MIRTATVRKTLQRCTKIIIKYYHGRILAGHIMNGKKLIAMRNSQNHTFFFTDNNTIERCRQRGATHPLSQEYS